MQAGRCRQLTFPGKWCMTSRICTRVSGTLAFCIIPPADGGSGPRRAACLRKSQALHVCMCSPSLSGWQQGVARCRPGLQGGTQLGSLHAPSTACLTSLHKWFGGQVCLKAGQACISNSRSLSQCRHSPWPQPLPMTALQRVLWEAGWPTVLVSGHAERQAPPDVPGYCFARLLAVRAVICACVTAGVACSR